MISEFDDIEAFRDSKSTARVTRFSAGLLLLLFVVVVVIVMMKFFFFFF